MVDTRPEPDSGIESQLGEMWRRYLEPPAGADTAPPRHAFATPYDVVHQHDATRLLRFRRQLGATQREPTLICFSLVNRPYILDLQPDRSVVRQLLDRGHEVYLIDWGVPADADHRLGLADYVCRRLRDLCEHTCTDAGALQVNLLGYCMGGTMAAMYTALNPEQVRNLVLMAAPIDFERDDGLLSVWTRPEYFDVDGLIDAFGNCPGWFLQSCFQLMRPVQNFVAKYLHLGDKLHDEAFLENFFAMERWASDSIPVAGETFREFVKWLYQQNRLVAGTLRLGSRRVELERIDCPLLLLTADQDHLVAPSSTRAVVEHVGSTDIASLTLEAGHIGLAVSSKAHRRLWPEVAEWLAVRSSPARPAGPE